MKKLYPCKNLIKGAFEKLFKRNIIIAHDLKIPKRTQIRIYIKKFRNLSYTQINKLVKDKFKVSLEDVDISSKDISKLHRYKKVVVSTKDREYEIKLRRGYGLR